MSFHLSIFPDVFPDLNQIDFRFRLFPVVRFGQWYLRNVGPEWFAGGSAGQLPGEVQVQALNMEIRYLAVSLRVGIWAMKCAPRLRDIWDVCQNWKWFIIVIRHLLVAGFWRMTNELCDISQIMMLFMYECAFVPTYWKQITLKWALKNNVSSNNFYMTPWIPRVLSKILDWHIISNPIITVLSLEWPNTCLIERVIWEHCVTSNELLPDTC